MEKRCKYMHVCVRNRDFGVESGVGGTKLTEPFLSKNKNSALSDIRPAARAVRAVCVCLCVCVCVVCVRECACRVLVA